MTAPAKQELRNLVRSKLTDGMTADEAADAVAALFYRVEDDWDHIEISTLGEEPGSHFHDQRWLVARIPREARDRRLPTADRTVAP